MVDRNIYNVKFGWITEKSAFSLSRFLNLFISWYPSCFQPTGGLPLPSRLPFFLAGPMTQALPSSGTVLMWCCQGKQTSDKKITKNAIH